MADPVTYAEVEDVLSSIRRLVSEEKRPMHSTPPSDAADRLVLTPSLRVEEKDTAPDAAKKPSAPTARADREAAPQDTVGETAKQLFDPSDDMPSDVYTRQVAPSLGWSDEDDALFDDLVAEEPAEKASEPESADVTEAEDIAEDYSDDPYNFADDADEDAADDIVDAVLVEEDTAEEAPTSLAKDAIAAADDNDMYDYDMLKRRSRDAAPAAPEAPEMAGEISTAIMEEADPSSASADAPEEDRQAGMIAASKAATLSAKIAALETAIGNLADTWEPDTPGTDDYSGTDQPAMAWEYDVSHDATGLPLRSEAAQAAWQEAHPDVVMIGTARAAAAAAAAMEERAAEQQRAAEEQREAEQRDAQEREDQQRASRAQDQAEEDQAAKDRAIAAARAAAAERVAADKRAEEQRLEAQAQAEAKSRAALEQDRKAVQAEVTPPISDAVQPAVEEDAAGLDYADDSQLLDEEALRDLVSEIVRAELQGALGERITRNVRKLVRREIHRALTAQELE